MTLIEIEEMRNKMHDIIKKYGLDSAEAQKASEELDEMIAEYYRGQIV